MPTINALQHIFSTVARGYFPQHGRGFQTVAVAKELVGTEDLRTLEEASLYLVSYERRAAGDFPVKETFFRLPSGGFAIGRSVDWGTDSLGRAGNYLTHHVVLSRDDWRMIGANPFAVLDVLPATTSLDLTPRDLPPLTLELDPVQIDSHVIVSLLRELSAASPQLTTNNGRRTINQLLSTLVIAAVDGSAKTMLLIGDEARLRKILRALFALLPTEERLRLTFSTHFHESHHLRPLFAFAAVKSRAEAPSKQDEYAIFDFDYGEWTQLAPVSAYASWLAECVQEECWEEVAALNAALNGLRSSARTAEDDLSATEPLDWRKDSLPVNARACAALWERASTSMTRLLIGDVQMVMAFLRQLSAPRPLADALLVAASPSQLCGASATPEMADDCLSLLRTTATRKLWRAWVNQWKEDEVLAHFLQSTQVWWQFWQSLSRR
ncbi:MAG: hypothetical protein ACREEM_52515 [Blastocatellia bacterium]